MKEMLGKPGSVCGLMLRLGQCLFAAASIGVMFSAFGFTNYTAFCYLIAAMGLQLFWSIGLACLDIYALKMKRDLQNPVLVSLFVVGDWMDAAASLKTAAYIFSKEKVTATLSLGAACSSAGIGILYVRDLNACNEKTQFPCAKLQISVAMAFLTWLLSVTSAHVMFWISASV